MQNGGILILYLLVWLGYVATVYVPCFAGRLNWGLVTLSHSVPTLVAVLMGWIFVLAGGSHVAQMDASAGQRMWSLWFDLWWPLLFATAGWAVIHLGLAIAAGTARSQRKWLGVLVGGLVVSGLAFLAVLSYVPDA